MVLLIQTIIRKSFKFHINMSEKEMVAQSPIRQSMLYIHNIHCLPYNSETYVEMFPGKKYEITIKPSRILLLEYPYRTACKNYTREYSKYGGYLSQKNCINKCKQNVLDRRCGCIPAISVPVTEQYEKCNTDNKLCTDKARKELSRCNNKMCPIGCEVDDYDAMVNSVFLAEVAKQFKCANNCSDTTVINLYIETYKLLLYNHKPKFQAIEILGYVGGNLGIWLGLSVPSIYKHLEAWIFLLASKLKNYRKSHKQGVRVFPRKIESVF